MLSAPYCNKHKSKNASHFYHRTELAREFLCEECSQERINMKKETFEIQKLSDELKPALKSKLMEAFEQSFETNYKTMFNFAFSFPNNASSFKADIMEKFNSHLIVQNQQECFIGLKKPKKVELMTWDQPVIGSKNLISQRVQKKEYRDYGDTCDDADWSDQESTKIIYNHNIQIIEIPNSDISVYQNQDSNITYLIRTKDGSVLDELHGSDSYFSIDEFYPEQFNALTTLEKRAKSTIAIIENKHVNTIYIAIFTENLHNREYSLLEIYPIESNMFGEPIISDTFNTSEIFTACNKFFFATDQDETKVIELDAEKGEIREIFKFSTPKLAKIFTLSSAGHFLFAHKDKICLQRLTDKIVTLCTLDVEAKNLIVDGESHTILIDNEKLYKVETEKFVLLKNMNLRGGKAISLVKNGVLFCCVNDLFWTNYSYSKEYAFNLMNDLSSTFYYPKGIEYNLLDIQARKDGQIRLYITFKESDSEIESETQVHNLKAFEKVERERYSIWKIEFNIENMECIKNKNPHESGVPVEDFNDEKIFEEKS